MNINPKIEKIFDNFKIDDILIPISYMRCKNKTKSYLTYYTWNEKPEGFSNDNPFIEGTYATIDIFSKGNFKKILKEVKRKLKENEITVTNVEAEDYEDDTGYYHVPVNFYLESEVEN